jgi:actin-related protein
VKQPIEYDAVTNRHDAAKIFHQTISNELRLDPTEHPAHLREAELNPKTNPVKMIFWCLMLSMLSMLLQSKL